jgi:hypothetical protein
VFILLRNKILKMQKRAIRNICNVNYTHHTLELFKELKIFPLQELIKFTQCTLTHSVVYKHGPKILDNQWVTNLANNPGIELRNAQDLYIPIAISEQVKRLPLFSFAKMWNTLSENKFHQNPALFKNLLKEEIWSNLT